MQHISESCRGRNAKNIGTDGRRVTSYGSTITHNPSTSELAASQDHYDTIEAEIDQLKEDVALLRMEANQGRTEPQTEHDYIVEKFLSTRSKSSIRSKGTKSDETTAMRLQRLHESQQNHNDIHPGAQAVSPALSSPLDFPALDSASADRALNSAGPLPRKLSYANVATNGMMEAIDQACAPAGKRRSDSKLSGSASNSQPSTHGETAHSSASQVQTASTSMSTDSYGGKDEDVSVIMTSNYASDTGTAHHSPTISKHDQIGENKHTIRQSPHFAQPTKSFARRTGETLRGDTASLSPKSPSDVSPGKTIRGRDTVVATSKGTTQQQQKRKSLPGDWLTAADSRSTSAAVELTAKSGNSTTTTTTSPSKLAKSGLPVPSAKAKVNQAAARDRNQRQQSPSPKKSSSYMAPTTATKQRSVITLGEPKSKVEKPATNTVEQRVDVIQRMQQPMLASRPSTAFSDNSSVSVHFILESESEPSQAQPRDTSVHTMGEATRNKMSSPCMVKAQPAAVLRSMSPKSPTRGSKAQSQVRSPMKERFSHVNMKIADALSSLPPVANTTTKRRTSHSNVLTPIVARLESEGILNKASQKNGVVQAYLQQRDLANGNALRAAQEASPKITSPIKPDSIPTKFTGIESLLSRKVIPPHLRPKQIEVCTASIGPEPDINKSSTTTTSKLWSAVVSGSTSADAPVATALRNGKMLKPEHTASRTPSLRATAEEFRPSLPQPIQFQPTGSQPIQMQPALPQPALPQPSFDMFAGRRWSTDYIPSQQWDMLTPEMRATIVKARANSQGQAYLSNAFQSQLAPIYAAANANAVSALNNMVAQRGLFNGTTSFVDENGSPGIVHASQTLKPCINPRKKTVQWMLEDDDGQEDVATFGRAPPPPIPKFMRTSTPTISPTSDDTSPLKTPYSTRGWRIGSAAPQNPYGWTGGDGKEIKFNGYGPHAERDPNSVVNFNFQGRTSSFGTAAMFNGFREDKENFQTDYVAPKSQRQWAEKLGYHKQPCGNVEITNAFEHLPFGPELARYCHDCAAR